MADADQLVASQEREQRGGQQRGSGGDQGAGDDSHMADAECRGRKGGAIAIANEAAVVSSQNGAGSSGPSHMADADNAKRWSHAEGRRDDDDGQNARREEEASGRQLGSATDHSHMADAVRSAGQQNAGSAFGNEASDGREGWDAQQPDGHHRLASHGKSYWSNAIWLTGADGKSRRAQPGISLLAHGIPNRVGKLRAYGNAIVPPLAAQVIGAYLDAEKAYGGCAEVAEVDA
jgi:DNA (cytosine-5)-methyltransferase 1